MIHGSVMHNTHPPPCPSTLPPTLSPCSLIIAAVQIAREFATIGGGNGSSGIGGAFEFPKEKLKKYFCGME
jgi:hypothetical protein